MTFLAEWWPQITVSAMLVINTSFEVYDNKDAYGRAGAVVGFLVFIGLLYAGGFYDV